MLAAMLSKLQVAMVDPTSVHHNFPWLASSSEFLAACAAIRLIGIVRHSHAFLVNSPNLPNLPVVATAFLTSISQGHWVANSFPFVHGHSGYLHTCPMRYSMSRKMPLAAC